MKFSNTSFKTFLNIDTRKLYKRHGHPIVAIKRQDLLSILIEELTSLGGKIHWISSFYLQIKQRKTAMI